ncbi:MAG TPA: YicC family protein, partial [Hyphomicrobiaceae bacterium]|nr:YicC family protein [Hyphomicrobiaceae bacterium]
TIDRATAPAEVRVNAAVLRAVTESALRLTVTPGISPPTADGLLALRGVLEQAEPVETDSEARSAAMLASLDEATTKLAEARAQEGARLADVIRTQLDQIERLAGEVERSPSRTPEAIKARLVQQVARIVGASSAIDPARLHQEVALLAVKADIDEELARLRSHLVAARELLGAKEPVGRKLDFLAQEFNREANTLCSKSNDVEVTRLGVELKVVIDQMREQVQNIE